MGQLCLHPEASVLVWAGNATPSPPLPHPPKHTQLVNLFRFAVLLHGLVQVLIWNQLARGHQELCAVMVAFNSVLQIVLYAPLSLFYLQVRAGCWAVLHASMTVLCLVCLSA